MIYSPWNKFCKIWVIWHLSDVCFRELLKFERPFRPGSKLKGSPQNIKKYICVLNWLIGQIHFFCLFFSGKGIPLPWWKIPIIFTLLLSNLFFFCGRSIFIWNPLLYLKPPTSKLKILIKSCCSDTSFCSTKREDWKRLHKKWCDQVEWEESFGSSDLLSTRLERMFM